LKIMERSFSEVGRVRFPLGEMSFLPLKIPEVIRIMQ